MAQKAHGPKLVSPHEMAEGLVETENDIVNACGDTSVGDKLVSTILTTVIDHLGVSKTKELLARQVALGNLPEDFGTYLSEIC